MKVFNIIRTLITYYLCHIKYFMLDNEAIFICDELQNLHLEIELLQNAGGINGVNKKIVSNKIDNKCSKYKQTRTK